jgi:hypothetical protein
MSTKITSQDIYNPANATKKENYNTAPRILRTVSHEAGGASDYRNMQKIGYDTLKKYGVYIVSIRGAGKTAYESYYILSKKENARHIPFGHIIETQPDTLSIYMKQLNSDHTKFYLYRNRDSGKKELQSSIITRIGVGYGQ